MNIKYIALLIVAMLTLGLANVDAQGDNTSAQAILNINLRKVQSLVVNTNQTTVNLEYTTKDDYSDGVSSTQSDHLIVFSTGAFNVSAKSSGTHLVGANGNELTIDASDVSLLASVGTQNNSLTYLGMSSIKLAAEDTSIFSSAKGGRDLKFNVKYTAAGGDKYINHVINNESVTTYTTTVTYTITAQ